MALKKNTAKQASTKQKSIKETTLVKTGKPEKSSTSNTKPSDKNISQGSREERIQKIKAILLQQRSALLNEAEVALNELPGVTLFPDMGDQASAETDMNFMLRLRGREQRLLKKIDEAIERIDNGTFGICEDCGNEIDLKRLEARPVTTMCIECKTFQEEEERKREV